jgi:hypothetical protein
MAKKMEWFIRRPHAIERFREYGGYPADTDSVSIEMDLRNALDEAAKDAPRNFLTNKCRDRETGKPRAGQFAVRIAVPKRNVVYAILQEPTSTHRSYDWVVPTVLTRDMFQLWTDTGKLGSIEDLPLKKRQLPKLKPQLCLHWANGDGRDHWGMYCADEISEEVRKLILQGVPRDKIKVYKEVPFKVDVQLGDFTS